MLSYAYHTKTFKERNPTDKVPERQKQRNPPPYGELKVNLGYRTLPCKRTKIQGLETRLGS